MKLKYLEVHNGKLWQKELVSKIVDELIDNSIYKLPPMMINNIKYNKLKIKNL